MNKLLEVTAFNPELIKYLVVDLIIAILLLGTMRFIFGLSSNVNSTEELSQKDNFAFGISIAGSIAALSIVLTGAITGESADNLSTEIIGMLIYGGLGLILIKVGRYIHDKIALNQFNKTELILQQNIAIGLVDAAGAIATAIMIRAVLLWVHGLEWATFATIIGGFVISQAVLIVVTRLRERQYAKDNQNDSFQQAISQGQLALAIRYSGQIISTALAITAASHFLTYTPEHITINLLAWLIFSIIMTFVMAILTNIAKRIVLWGINLVEEVDQQQNIGVASVEMATSIAIGLILTALMA